MDRVVLYARDFTDQKRTEIALQESEEKYRTLAEAAHDMIFVINEDDRIEYTNSHAAGMFGITPEGIIGKGQSSLFPATISKRQRAGIAATLATGKPIYAENWIKFHKGENAYISTWLVPLTRQINGRRAVLGVSRDITNLRRVQEELEISHKQLERRVEERTKELSDLSVEMRKLAKKTINAQEEERRRISRKLHDDTGQELVMLKYSLSELLNELPATPDFLYKRISDSIKATNIILEKSRAIAHSLRPPLLDAGGLNVSLKDLCQEISHRTKIKVTYTGVELNNLSDEIALTLFRFIQEAFANLLKHSQATRVRVKLQYKLPNIIASVSDNGVGFGNAQKTKGIGLIGLRERLGFLGGELQIKASPGKGTIIKASIPWKVETVET